MVIALYVVAMLTSGDEFLLARRSNQNFGKGLYSLIGGKVEENETALAAIKREIFEETGLEIPTQDFTLVHTLHRNGSESPFILLIFKADISKKPAPENKETEKHDDVRFFNIKNLPKNILPAHKQVIECIQKNISYSEHGW